MLRRTWRYAPLAIVVGLVLLAGHLSGQTHFWRPSTEHGDWPAYNGDNHGTRYSPLDQITADNFKELEVAWRIKTDMFGPKPEFKLEGTPIAIKGILYATAGSRRAVLAIDGASGEILWVHSENEGRRSEVAPRQLSGRGLAYWTDGKEERIIYYTIGYQMVALDAKTGQRIASFGNDGIVDLKKENDQEIDPLDPNIGYQEIPVIANDVIVVGAAHKEGMTPKSYKNVKGYIRGYDVRTGKRLWIFHTIPKKGEFGYDTWLNGSAEYTGNAGVWTRMSVDEDLGLAYLPVESATSDYYGGRRPGNALFAESLVCVDLKTGQRKWHFQITHHGLWDWDLPAAPILADLTIDGRPRKIVIQPTKQAMLYVFDRATGEPIWPIEEKKVEVGDVPGEWYSPTQPVPTKPPAYARNGFTEDILIDFTPELNAKAKELIKKYKIGPIYTPPVVSKIEGPLATLTIATAGGATNWPGGSYDPDTHNYIAYACNSCVTPIGLVKPPSPDVSDEDYIAGTAGQKVEIRRGPGEGGGDQVRPTTPAAPQAAAPAPPAGGGGGALSVQGLPLVKPPYSLISAINMERGEIVWQTPHGDTPDAVRNNPALKGLDIPAKAGQTGYNVGTLITRSLVIAGDQAITTTAEHPRGAMMRAYDKRTGKEVGAVWMPAPETGSPMTYTANGKQYVVIAVSGGTYSGEYISFTLPRSEPRPTER